MGKGSGRRPQLVPSKQVENNWARTFKKKEKSSGKQTDVIPTDSSSNTESSSTG